MHPSKFCHEIKSEQCHCPGKCLCHLSKTHQTVDCTVKKECDKFLAAQKETKTQPSVSNTVGQLHYITKDFFKDAVTDDSADALLDHSNDTKEDELHYFAHMTDHYLHLARVNHTVQALKIFLQPLGVFF